MPLVSGSARGPASLPKRVAVGFLMPATAVCVSALLIPGYVRPDAPRTVFVVLTAVVALSVPIIWFLPPFPRPAIGLSVLAMDAAIVIGEVCVTGIGGRVGFALFALPTMYVALFLGRRMLLDVQAPAVVLGVVAAFWLTGDRGAVLAMHSAVTLFAVLSPAVALLVLRQRLDAALLHQRDLAGTDPLTGLANRRGLAAQAGLVAGHAQREAVEFCVVTLDLDHFKRVNDARGHRFGDVVLQRISDTLRASTRALDVVARLGGEEFAVLSALALDDALALAERLRRQVAIDCADVAVTASLGMAVSSPPREPDVEQVLWSLVDRADDFMYVAKRLGRNRVVSAPPVAASRPGP
jgi:diguanylate cyclase (GGDEF)-like protein